MASVNKVILVGNLGADPEVRYLPNGEAVVNLRLATTDQWKDKDGNKQEATEWHRVVFFGRQAEVCGQYLKKGKQIYVEGSLRTNKYTDKDGIERYATEIRGDRMQMLGQRDGGGEGTPRDDSRQGAPRASNSRPAGGGGAMADFDDDIPFARLSNKLALVS